MKRDELKGRAEQVRGRAKQALGDLTDDERLRDEGEIDEATGLVREGVARTKRRVGESIEDFGKRIKR